MFQLRDLDLSVFIANTMKILKRLVSENIQTQIKLASEPMFINADAGMMDQVLMNLAVNFRDVMPKGGRLAIETPPQNLTNRFAGNQPRPVPVPSCV